MKFNFTSQVCTSREQSERLLALGLKKETADCCWSFNIGVYDESRRYTLVLGKCEYMHDVPAWSLHRLIKIYDKTCIFWTDCFDNHYEAMISRIADKIKRGELNKEYLE